MTKKTPERATEQIIESGYVIVDTNNKFTIKDTFSSSRRSAWNALGFLQDRKEFKRQGFRCVKAVIITEAID